MKKKETNPADLTNPNNDAYWQRLGYDKRPKNWQKLLKNRPKSKRARSGMITFLLMAALHGRFVRTIIDR